MPPLILLRKEIFFLPDLYGRTEGYTRLIRYWIRGRRPALRWAARVYVIHAGYPEKRFICFWRMEAGGLLRVNNYAEGK